MRVLALDTSNWWGGVALVQQVGEDAGPETVAELGMAIHDSHAIRLTGWIELLLEQAGWSKSSLDGYVAVRGPGSFTGVRVGLGTVRGLGLAADRPCAGVNSLEAIAESFGPAGLERIPLLGAGRGEVYGARFDPRESPPRSLRQPWVGSAGRVTEDASSGVVICGPGSAELAARDLEPAGERYRLVPAPRTIAAAAGRLALLRGEIQSDAEPTMSPLYLRPADAELKAGQRRG